MDNGNGVRVGGKITLAFEYDCLTFQVSIGGDPIPLSLAQMICGEGARVLEEQRRVAAAMALKQSLQQQAEDVRIAAALRKGA